MSAERSSSFWPDVSSGSAVAVETIGNWYWIVDEIEAAGCVPKLVHPRQAKLMMGEINKTDKLDPVKGMPRLTSDYLAGRPPGAKSIAPGRRVRLILTHEDEVARLMAGVFDRRVFGHLPHLHPVGDRGHSQL
jgi:hypothetical protein